MNQLISLLFFCFILIGVSTAQSPKRMAKKAFAEYKKEHYAAAISLYEKALSKEKNSTWLYKLGNCYRILNRTAKAEVCFEDYLKVAKNPKAKVHYYYANVLLSNQKYELAREHLKIFIEKDPIHGTNANYLLNNIENIKSINPYFENVEIQPFPFNSKMDEHGAVFWNENIIFVSDRKRGFTFFKKKAGKTGRDFLALYLSTLQEASYQSPKLLPRRINSLNKNVGSASFFLSSNIMIFAKNDIRINSKNEYPMQLFQSVYNKKKKKWSKAKKLNICSPKINYMHPAISPDGKTLVFTSKKKRGSQGGMDLYISHRRSGDNWSKPRNLGATVNTSSDEGFPFIDAEGKLYFCSKGHLGLGGFDIFVTQKGDDNQWQTPVNLGFPINSPQDDISFSLDKTNKKGIVASSRNQGDDDLFIFEIKTTSKSLSEDKKVPRLSTTEN